MSPADLVGACQSAETQGLTIRFIIPSMTKMQQPCYALVCSRPEAEKSAS
jgi:hypothetical protein